MEAGADQATSIESSTPQVIKADQFIESAVPANGVAVEFRWKAEPMTFGGFDQGSLTQFVQQAADFFHISKKDQGKIHIYFGDHSPVEFNGTARTPVGRTYSVTQPGSSEGVIEGINIVMNRSEELHLEGYDAIQGPDTDFSKGDVSLTPDNGCVAVLARYPWESIGWLIAEEINHAGVALKMGSMGKINKASQKYQKYIKDFHGDRVVNPLSRNLMETTATRQVLRFLQIVAQRHDPSRAGVYDEALQRSLSERLAIGISNRLTLSSAFVKTGYVPSPAYPVG